MYKIWHKDASELPCGHKINSMPIILNYEKYIYTPLEFQTVLASQLALWRYHFFHHRAKKKTLYATLLHIIRVHAIAHFVTDRTKLRTFKRPFKLPEIYSQFSSKLTQILMANFTYIFGSIHTHTVRPIGRFLYIMPAIYAMCCCWWCAFDMTIYDGYPRIFAASRSALCLSHFTRTIFNNFFFFLWLKCTHLPIDYGRKSIEIE